MTIQAGLTDADSMRLITLAKILVLLIIVTLPAIHRERFFLRRCIPMVARVTSQSITVGRGMSRMIENHTPDRGIKFNRLGFLDRHEILRIMTKVTGHRTSDMAGVTVFRNAVFMDRVIATGLTVLSWQRFRSYHRQYYGDSPDTGNPPGRCAADDRK